MSEEVKTEEVTVTKEFVDVNNLRVLIDLQKEMEFLSLKIENVKLQLRLMYKLSEEDRVDIKTGEITRA